MKQAWLLDTAIYNLPQNLVLLGRVYLVFRRRLFLWRYCNYLRHCIIENIDWYAHLLWSRNAEGCKVSWQEFLLLNNISFFIFCIQKYAGSFAGMISDLNGHTIGHELRSSNMMSDTLNYRSCAWRNRQCQEERRGKYCRKVMGSTFLKLIF